MLQPVLRDCSGVVQQRRSRVQSLWAQFKQVHRGLLSFPPSGFGLGEPASTEPLGRHTRQIRLEIQDRRAVEHVDARDAQHAAVARDQLDDRQPDRVGTLRRARREDAVRPVVGGRPRRQLDAIHPVEEPQHIEVRESLDIDQAFLEPGFDLQRTLSAVLGPKSLRNL